MTLSNARDREMAMIAWVIVAGVLLWLGSCGLAATRVPEGDESDDPASAASTHAAAWWRAR